MSIPGSYEPSEHTASPAYRLPADTPPPAPTGFITTAPPRKPSFWRTTAGSLTIAGIGCVVVFALMAGAMMLYYGGLSGKADDVTITGCASSSSGYARVSYTITNSSSQARTYRMQFEVRASDGARIGDGGEYASNVPAGGTVRGERTLAVSGTPSSCVVDVS